MRGVAALWRISLLAVASGCAWAQGPSFNCAKARQPAELAICGNDKLSQLDRILVEGYNYTKASESLAAADKIGIPFYYQRIACGADVQCIAKSRINKIQELAAAGAPVALPAWLTESRS